MGKPKRSGSGFSAAKPAAAPKQQASKGSADQAVEEQQAVALINQGKRQEAEGIYKELIAEGAKNRMTYVSLAAIKGMQVKCEEVIMLLSRALKIAPSNPEALNSTGVVLHELGELDKAISFVRRALELSQNYRDAQNNLGPCLLERGI